MLGSFINNLKMLNQSVSAIKSKHANNVTL